ncbi:hypothetical protein AVEN_80927-1 [Araneus ventricosus]|uniref:Uncharacterized protein n=1 Tax=Araneus ventricosus TaxID=182803 RepID=A0A4Y2GMC9_ARAVE|nr:hypothetical protein AVEN_80927-1 [Araneus ventricosus]
MTTPRKCRVKILLHSIFQTIHLDGSFTTTTRKPQIPSATCHSDPLPSSKREVSPAPISLEWQILTFSPPRIYACRISAFMAQESKWSAGNPDWLNIQISEHTAPILISFCTDDRLWRGAAELAWSRQFANVQP